MYYARHRVGMATLCFAVKIFCISINPIFIFMNPARCPQDALRQRRDGEKEDYYV